MSGVGSRESEGGIAATDGKTYTFHLRQGVKFHDGRPFVARQVVSSLTRVLDPATRSGAASFFAAIDGAKEFVAGSARSVAGLQAVDDSTVRITLATPLA